MSKQGNGEDGESSSLSSLKNILDKGDIIDEMEESIKSDRPPKLVISVIGDSIDYTPNTWPTHRFKQALIHAIKTFGDTWILCECNVSQANAGRVSKTVSEALIEHLQVPWHQMKDQPSAYLYNIWSQIPEENRCPAKDEEYFKSLVLKNPQPATPDTPDPMTNIVDKLSNQHVRAFYLETSYQMVLPVMIVVVEGNIETIKIVRDAVVKNIPVILAKGSGMAADLIHFCLEQDKDVNEIPNLMQKIALLFGEKTKLWNHERKKVLQDIVENQNLLMSYDVYEDTPETFAEKTKQIILTSWALQNRDLTKIEPTEPPPDKPKSTPVSEIATDSCGAETQAAAQGQEKKPGSNKVHPGTPPPAPPAPPPSQYEPPQKTNAHLPRSKEKPKTSDEKQTVHEESKSPAGKAKPSSPLAFYLFYQRLQQEKHATNKGESIQKDVLDVKDIKHKSQNLMMEALIAGEYEFVDVLMDIDYKKDMKVNFKTLYGQAADNLQMILKLDRHEVWNYKGKIKVENCPAAQRLKQLLRNYNAYSIPPEEEKKYEITQRLLLWAVQTNQVKMAEMLWKKTQYPILTALVASELLRKMSRKAWDNKETVLSNELKDHSDIFCQRAVDTAESFYKEHPKYAVEALGKKYYVWGVYDDPIEFALKYRQYTFVASEVVQRHFHKKWYGKHTYRTWRHLYLICFERSQSSPLSDRLWRIGSATLTWFSIHYFFFILFLLCLSAFVLSNLKEVMPMNERSVYEYMAYLWITGDFIEEYKSALVVIKDSQLCKKPCECLRAWLRGLFLHFNDFWNLLDFAGYILMIIAVAFRFQQKEEYEDITRQLFSITMYVMYMRFLHVLLVSRSIGITIIMLKEALKELIRFIVIAAVFVISTGVFYHANLYPNHYDLFSTFGVRYWSFWRIIYLPFWAIFGEFKEELEGVGEDGCSNNETVYVNDVNVERCPQKDFLVSVMSGVYTMIASLLLVNLIIAMFTFRFEDIKNNSEKLWRFHRSKVINEFEGRSPSPLNFVWNIVVILRWIVESCIKEDLYYKKKKDIRKIIKDRWKESDNNYRHDCITMYLVLCHLLLVLWIVIFVLRMTEEVLKILKKKYNEDKTAELYQKLRKIRKEAMENIEQEIKDIEQEIKVVEELYQKLRNIGKKAMENIEQDMKGVLEELNQKLRNIRKKAMENIEQDMKGVLEEVLKILKKKYNEDKTAELNQKLRNIRKKAMENIEQDMKGVLEDLHQELRNIRMEAMENNEQDIKGVLEELYQKLRNIRKETMENIEQDIKGVLEDKSIMKVLDEIHSQWQTREPGIEDITKIQNNKEIKDLLNDDWKNMKKEVKKRWNIEKDFENIQKTIAERWERKDSM